MTVVEALALVGLAAWILLALDRSRAWPSRLRLDVLSHSSAVVPRSDEVVILVPARNEAALIGSTLPSLLQQMGHGSEVVVVDDGSTDRTTEAALLCARRHGADSRLTVLTAPSAHRSENGKIAALQEGLAQLQEDRRRAGRRPPQWILLTDADIVHRRRSVRDLVAVASGSFEGGELDLVSVMARLHAESCWERLLIPPFVFFFHILYPFRRVADPESSIAAAAGGCVLVRTETLLQIGGLESVRHEIIDDVALAKELKGRGGRVLLTLDEGIHSVRRYERLRDLWEMISRAAFAQLRFSPLLLILTLAALAILVVAPPAICVVALSRLWFEASSEPSAMIRSATWAASTWLLQLGMLLPWVRHHRVGWFWAATLPAAGLLYALMTTASAWNHWRGRGSRWKDRRVRLDMPARGRPRADQGSRTDT